MTTEACYWYSGVIRGSEIRGSEHSVGPFQSRIINSHIVHEYMIDPTPKKACHSF
jgi:hypothetical protein